jgi:hypothetical protein
MEVGKHGRPACIGMDPYGPKTKGIVLQSIKLKRGVQYYCIAFSRKVQNVESQGRRRVGNLQNLEQTTAGLLGPNYSKDQRPPPQECKEHVGDARDNILEKERIPTCLLV